MNNKIQLLSEIQIKALLNDFGYKDNGDALRDESDLSNLFNKIYILFYFLLYLSFYLFYLLSSILVL